MRAVLDPNVLISALLAPTGPSAGLLGRWPRGEFELVVSDELLAELSRTLVYPKVRARVTPEQADALVALLRRGAIVAASPDEPPQGSSRGVEDDQLLALAATTDSILVTWKADLLNLQELPVESPASFLRRVDESR